MNREKSKVACIVRESRAALLLGSLAAVAIAVACSGKPKQKLNYDEPVASARPALVKTVATTSSEPLGTLVNPADVPAKPLSKTITYKSRDYGVSFEYPRQYAYVSAKTIANGDASRKAKSDGSADQFTLASVEVPKGFYPDTDFDRGYLTVSLNESLSEDECLATLGPNFQSANINGIDFKWVEADRGGSGESAKVRNFITYTNATCYELELGVKSKNEKGMAREVDPDQVFKRLDAIMATVKIKPTLQPAKESVQESAGK